MTAEKKFPVGTTVAHVAKSKFNRVIIIDDSEFDLHIAETLIKNENLSKKIDLRMKAEEVIAELTNIKRLDDVPELILLDLNMPGMNGLSFLSAFQLMPEFVKKKCHIVTVSGNDDKQIVDITYSNPNVIDYIRKPIDANAIRKFQKY